MDNNNFWSSISDIIQKGFDKIGQQKLINYAKQFTNRQLLFKRYTKDEQFGCAAGGTLHVIATILAGAEARTNRISESGGCFQREQQRAKAQCKIIEEWAKSVGCWVDNVDNAFDRMFGSQLTEGGEAHVYDNGPYVVKRIGLDYYVLPSLAFDRISMHNTLFPATKMTVIGYGASSEGEFQILVQQQFIHGTKVTDEEIHNFAESIGFKLINPRNWTYATPYIYLSDMHDENVIKTPQGSIIVIDCDIRINTKELRCGGIRILTNEVEFANL